MRKVAVVGAGMTKFVRRAQETGKELSWQAAKMALDSCELTLDQVDLVAGVSQVEGSLDARDTAANDQGGVSDGKLLLVLRVEPASSSHGRFDDILCFDGGHRAVLRMNPGTVLADIGHLHEVWVQSCLGNTVPESGFVQAGRTRCDYHAVELFLHHHAFDLLLAGIGASVSVANRHDHVRKRFCVFPHLFRVYATGDVRATIAHKHPYPRVIHWH